MLFFFQYLVRLWKKLNTTMPFSKARKRETKNSRNSMHKWDNFSFSNQIDFSNHASFQMKTEHDIRCRQSTALMMKFENPEVVMEDLLQAENLMHENSDKEKEVRIFLYCIKKNITECWVEILRALKIFCSECTVVVDQRKFLGFRSFQKDLKLHDTN